MNERLTKLSERVVRLREHAVPLGMLLIRVSLGWLFIESGWGKLHGLENVTDFFRELGIPAPSLMAPFVALTELLGGIAVLIGAFSRLASVALLVTMVVAILTAKREDISSFSDLIGTTEYLYALLLLAVALYGPEAIAAERAWKRKRDVRKPRLLDSTQSD